MNNFPWLTVIGVLPAVGAIVVALLPKGRDLLAKQTALAFSTVALILTIVLAVRFDPNAAGSGDGHHFQFVEQHQWIPAFGVHYALGLDGIGLVLFVLTALLTPVVMLASWNDADPPAVEGEETVAPRRSVKTFFALMLVLETLALGVFSATDVFLFYLLFEATLIPVYFLIGSYGGPRRSYAAVKFLIYSLLGGLLMLASVIGLYALSVAQTNGQPSFLLNALTQLNIDPATQKWLFAGFFVAFAIKAPMWPVHTWLPDAAREATPGTSVLLVSILDKIGTFGMIRFCLQLFPDASKWATPVVITLAVISVIYGAVLAIGQRDIKRLIAYSSVSHFGVIVLGIFAMTSTGQTGATLYMLNHGLSTAALFLVGGYLISRRGSSRISDFGGVDKVAPVLSGTFLFACLSGLALPGLAPFVSEFLSLSGTFSRYELPAIIATCGIILAALYMLIVYQRTMTGPTASSVAKMRDLRPREIFAVAPLIILILVLGLFPKPAIALISPAVESTMSRVGVTDPAPKVPVTAPSEGTK
ncbi:NADH-quinone oxidoreductase subunit M [Actinopolymorpha pittospori]|uniref:NADH-quinone oxidoreductase subunit M n=1 Tax=Actinopolymorpha pittospori TaxID=648752 RepID=A0A927MV54_9ACTN|nr:NADH-quinone oxidoreductase subunit M [Actinopolymorpha pittospori]